MRPAEFNDDFKRDAIAKVSRRLGGSQHSLYTWRKKFWKASDAGDDDQFAEIRRLKEELARVTGERDIIKCHRVFRQGYKVRYAFVVRHRLVFSMRAMSRCLLQRLMRLAQKRPEQTRAHEDRRPTQLVRTAWKDSSKVYRYRKLPPARRVQVRLGRWLALDRAIYRLARASPALPCPRLPYKAQAGLLVPCGRRIPFFSNARFGA